MTDRRSLSPHVTLAIRELQAAYSNFQFDKRHEDIWERDIGGHSPERVARAVAGLIRTHTHGAPSLSQLVQALEGRWHLESAPRTDAHGVVQEGATWAKFHVKRCTFTNEVLVAFDEKYNLIQWPSQNHIASTKRVLERYSHLLPMGVKETLLELEQRSNPRPENYLGGKPNFHSGLLGE